MNLFSTGQQLGQQLGYQGVKQAKRAAGGVRRRNETRGQFKNRVGTQNDNADIKALFQGIQQTRTKVHKDTLGNIIDPNAPTGLNKLYADNPHLKPAASQQVQNDWQARNQAGINAVAQKKAQQNAAQNPYGNVITAPNGSRAVTNSMGQIVGTSAPVGDGTKKVFNDATGQMVPMGQWFADRNAVQSSKGMAPSPIAQAWNTAQNIKPDAMDLLFSGKQSSPPGGVQAGMVGPPVPQGAPGGELFGQMPEFKSSGMVVPQQGPVYPPNAGPQYTPMMPNDGPQQSATLYPFQYGNMAQPAYGTLAEKESARRKALTGSKGVVGSYGQWIEDKATSMENAVQDMLRSIFGDPTLQTTNQVMQDPMQQQLNLGSAIPWMANLIPMAQPRFTAPQPINEVEALNQLEQLLHKPTQTSKPSMSFSEFLNSMMQGNPSLSF